MRKKKLILLMTAGILTMSMIVTPSIHATAGAAADGQTNAKETVQAGNGAYDSWETEWNRSVKNDWTQISLTPGSDATELNFAWYSLASSNVPKLKIGEGPQMKDAKIYEAVQQDAIESKDGIAYKSNKVTVKGLKKNKTYYYSYQVDGVYTKPVKYQTKDTEAFSFIFVGDPQIGSSNALKGADTEEFYKAQSDSVCNDSFNWNATLNSAMDKTKDQAAFIVSAGDQIRTTDRRPRLQLQAEARYGILEGRRQSESLRVFPRTLDSLQRAG